MSTIKKARYRLVCRGSRGGIFYCHDTKTGARTSLGTHDEKAARKLVAAKNSADEQPALNLHLAKAYLAGTDSAMATRTWNDAFATRCGKRRKARPRTAG